MASPARRWTADQLDRFYRDRRYSNIQLEEELRKSAMPEVEKGLATRLFYGVIERQLTLDHLLSSFCKTKLSRLHPLVLQILRCGAYQLLYMDKIPAPAAVNEAVELTKRSAQFKAAGMVNAVLRAIDRDGMRILADLPDDPDGWSIRYSCPRPIIDLWIADYGAERARKLAECANDIPPHTLRINTAATNADQVRRSLAEAGVAFEEIPGLENALTIFQNSLGKSLETLQKNWYYYQDMASQWACRALDARPGERIIDVCAAPGGKSFTVAQSLNGQGEVVACDLYAAKCEVIRRRAEELSLPVVKTRQRDASAPCAKDEKAAFDRVICDLPCSGLGVIRRKPEIRYKDPAPWADLPALQRQILDRSAELVRPGGVLQYSTCTLRRAENEEIADWFLQTHPDFQPRVLPLEECFARAGIAPDHRITLFPDEQGSDGFFIASFQRTR
ncbi:MAG: 16S rRNA (cytosine(967)-C(5))-methyltransferase RsmB [Acutalibacteraceae bacterium]|jgi:16S rRNA (cytosine967-C5)-methyltransferase